MKYVYDVQDIKVEMFYYFVSSKYSNRLLNILCIIILVLFLVSVIFVFIFGIVKIVLIEDIESNLNSFIN